MTKESQIALNKVDCNCNSCIHMVRNNYKKRLSDQLHEQWQLEHFNREREDELFVAFTLRDKTAIKKAAGKKATIKKPIVNFGYCKKLDFKEVSFIPGTCQLDTQHCFEHR